jgi:hypothetical protein
MQSTREHRIRPDVVWRVVMDEVIILDQASWKYLSVKGSGAHLWPALVEGSTTDALADRLVEQYGIDADTARTDVEAFVGMLAERQLLAS